MLPFERSPFTNPLAHAASPYLRQHAHNPVFWYPWGDEALARARTENKPILLSIGYSSCYWCHVMEREVFENPSIAALMNRLFINIKVDREEHPQIDTVYMAARQIMTREGGWPNHVFLTPDLKPFYAGGTFGPADAYGKPAFPRLLEWLNYQWTMQQDELQSTAQQVTQAMQDYLTYAPPPHAAPPDMAMLAQGVFASLSQHYDGRAGGFFQAPKFPHECFLHFLLAYHEHTGDAPALDMVTHTLEKMAAGGIYDHVGCGFHRYAIDKEWYVPHFEKMLYTQALLARAYTDAARLSNSAYLADIARSILDFTCGPLTDAAGGFYAAIDAETDGVEGAYYAWTAEELQALLTPEEVKFFTHFYALADIPQFPGHKHAQGQVIIARKPLAEAAHDHKLPYVAVAALVGQVMNKLLIARNQRPSPNLDNKIIAAWNGLMIDAFAYAGQVFGEKRYIAAARKAANFLLQHMTDNDGNLLRIYAAGRAQLAATLEDYAYVIQGLLSLQRAASITNMGEAAITLMQQAEALFTDPSAPGFFFTPADERLPVRIKSGEDGALPNANAVMAHNYLDLFTLTGDAAYRGKAQALVDFFLRGRSAASAEYATMLQAALRLQADSKTLPPAVFDSKKALEVPGVPDDVITVSAALTPEDAKAGQERLLTVTLAMKEGWHINANPVNRPFLLPTQADIQGKGVELLQLAYPEPRHKSAALGWEEPLWIYEGQVSITARLRLTSKAKKRPPIRVMLRFQPCCGELCLGVRDVSLTV